MTTYGRVAPVALERWRWRLSSLSAVKVPIPLSAQTLCAVRDPECVGDFR